MRPLEHVPAVRRIETDRPKLFAIEVTGEFNSADAENLCGLLEGAYALHDRIDLLIRIEGLESVDLTDVARDTVRSMRDHLARHVDRCAIIEDGGWSPEIERLLKPDDGAETRRFAPNEEPQAWLRLEAQETAPNG